MPGRFRYVVICGLTGSGKSRLIAALAAEGAQVLDLEALARHRGSLLGDLPDDPQPSQKAFDSELVATLGRFDPARPVYVESESRKIGTVQVPDALLAAMRGAELRPRRVAAAAARRAAQGASTRISSPTMARSALRLEPLVPVHGKKTVERWIGAAQAGDFDTLVDELLVLHYDPTYARSIGSNFPRVAEAIDVAPSELIDAAFGRSRASSMPACEPGLPRRKRRCPRTPSASSTSSPKGRSPAIRCASSRTAREPRRRDDAGARAAVQPVGDHLHPAVATAATARVRIFTPTFEMPFAGHPTLGTAHVVRDLLRAGDAVTLEMKAGVIPVERARRRLDAPGQRAAVARRRRSPAELAAMLGLDEADVCRGRAVGRHRFGAAHRSRSPRPHAVAALPAERRAARDAGSRGGVTPVACAYVCARESDVA